jgi:aspartate/tyrosine/aromatic aminotransferase
MSVFLQPIYTQTVGAGGAGSITFNNIPQTFTDLKIVISARCNNTNYDNLMLRFNSDTTVANYSTTNIYGDASGGYSERVLNAYSLNYAGGSLPNANSTANTFGNMEVYIPNYLSANYKQIITDNVAENNSATTYIRVTSSASLYRSTSAISSISIFAYTTLAQYSTFSLYGVLRQGI